MYLIALLTLAEITPVKVRAWSYHSNHFHYSPSLLSGSPIPVQMAGDLNNDGKREHLSIENGVAILYSSEKIVWKSPEAWHVTQAMMTDLNQDNVLEIAMVIWRPYQPWFIDRYIPHKGRLDAYQDKEGQSCHFALIGWKANGYGELWVSSALAHPIVKFLSIDLDRNGTVELVALENSYQNPYQERMLFVWEWNGFGFTLTARLHGNFKNLSIIATRHQTLYLLSEG